MMIQMNRELGEKDDVKQDGLLFKTQGALLKKRFRH